MWGNNRTKTLSLMYNKFKKTIRSKRLRYVSFYHGFSWFGVVFLVNYLGSMSNVGGYENFYGSIINVGVQKVLFN